MKTLRKPLFWGFVLLFGVLLTICCALVVFVYIGNPLTLFGKPQEVYSAPVDKESAVQATLTALRISQKEYYDKRDIDNTLKVTQKIIEMAPDNAERYDEAAFIIHDLAQARTNLDEYQNLIELGLKYADKGISLKPNFGNLYRERANLILDLQGVSQYRADREYLNQFWVDNILAEVYFGSTRVHPERLTVFTKTSVGDCEGALAETDRIAKAQGLEDSSVTRNIEGIYESVYTCLGDYQKALDHHKEYLKKTNQTEMNCGCAASTASYYYLLGQPDKAMDLLNQTIQKNPHFGGDRYFIRAVVEFDQGKYDEALKDVEMAEGNSWSSGMFSSYIEGLNAARLGNTEMAIKYLQFAEATMGSDYPFAIDRSREELKKLGAPTLEITPSVKFTGTSMPTYPTVDLKDLPYGKPEMVITVVPVGFQTQTPEIRPTGTPNFTNTPTPPSTVTPVSN